jgi:excisionase family DNA binding protein
MNSNAYLNPHEAAAYLRTSVSTLAKRRLYNSSPKFYRIGRAIRYRQSDLDAYMAANAATSTSDTTNSGGQS